MRTQRSLHSVFHCIVCNVSFNNFEDQRQHYFAFHSKNVIKSSYATSSLIQSTKPKEKLIEVKPVTPEFKCEACDITCISEIAFDFHIEGKKHKNAVIAKKLIKSGQKIDGKVQLKTSNASSAKNANNNFLKKAVNGWSSNKIVKKENVNISSDNNDSIANLISGMKQRHSAPVQETKHNHISNSVSTIKTENVLPISCNGTKGSTVVLNNAINKFIKKKQINVNGSNIDKTQSENNHISKNASIKDLQHNQISVNSDGPKSSTVAKNHVINKFIKKNQVNLNKNGSNIDKPKIDTNHVDKIVSPIKLSGENCIKETQDIHVSRPRIDFPSSTMVTNQVANKFVKKTRLNSIENGFNFAKSKTENNRKSETDSTIKLSSDVPVKDLQDSRIFCSATSSSRSNTINLINKFIDNNFTNATSKNVTIGNERQRNGYSSHSIVAHKKLEVAVNHIRIPNTNNTARVIKPSYSTPLPRTNCISAPIIPNKPSQEFSSPIKSERISPTDNLNKPPLTEVRGSNRTNNNAMIHNKVVSPPWNNIKTESVSRIPYNCPDCNINFISKELYDTHFKGIEHERTIKMKEYSRLKSLKHPSVYCDVCDIFLMIDLMKGHLSGDKHKRKCSEQPEKEPVNKKRKVVDLAKDFNYCGYCLLELDNVNELINHYQSGDHLTNFKKLDPAKLHCPICTMNFESESFFNLHVKGFEHYAKANDGQLNLIGRYADQMMKERLNNLLGFSDDFDDDEEETFVAEPIKIEKNILPPPPKFSE